MVRIEHTGESIIAMIYGDIDHHTARGIREEIDTQLERLLPRQLVMDFTNVSFMDSSGVGLIMGRYKRMNSLNLRGGIRVVCTSPAVKRVIQLAGLNRLVKIEE